MKNMLNYADKLLDDFEKTPLNEIDCLIMSWISYLNFPSEFDNLRKTTGIKLKELFCKEHFENMVSGVQSPEDTIKLLTELSSSPRFRDIRMFNFSHELNSEKNIQFGAVAYQISADTIFIAFRGTDSTFTGWKEDFSLALAEPIPSQKKAIQYLEQVCNEFDGNIFVGGHSKGGNLAVYSSARCNEDIQSKIKTIYSFDGPGFSPEELEFEGYSNIRKRIEKFLPQSSLIGMFFEQECEYKIVKSNNIGIAQHNPFSWILENNSFCYVDNFTADAKLIYESLNNWIFNLKEEDRRKFINTIFELLEETGASDFGELGKNLHQNIQIIAKKIISLDKDTRIFLINCLHSLATDGAKNVKELLAGNI